MTVYLGIFVLVGFTLSTNRWKMSSMDVWDGTNFKRSELYLELDNIADNQNKIKKIKKETMRFTKKVRAQNK